MNQRGVEIEGTKPWHEDDAFWETWGPIMFTQQRLADAAAEVGQADAYGALSGSAYDQTARRLEVVAYK